MFQTFSLKSEKLLIILVNDVSEQSFVFNNVTENIEFKNAK